MKLIQCVIRREKLQSVVDRLVNFSVCFTVSDVSGYGRQKAQTAVYRGVAYEPLLPRVMLEIAVDDNLVLDVAGIITRMARTGETGDGRIFVLPVDEVYHIRTGFMD